MGGDEGVEITVVSNDVWGGTTLEWGWEFTDITNMVDVASLARNEHCIKRLIIVAHGAVKAQGYTCFDPDASGTEIIDGAAHDPLQPKGTTATVKEQLKRLKGLLCPDGLIEIRICEFGTGENGTRALQAIADVVGVPVTAPMDTIKSIAGFGGLSVEWKTVYPSIDGIQPQQGFWRDKLVDVPKGPPSSPQIPTPKGSQVTAAVLPLPAAALEPKPWTAKLPVPLVIGGAIVALAAGTVVVAQNVGQSHPSNSSSSTGASQAKPPPGASIVIPGPAPGSPVFVAFINTFDPAAFITDFAVDAHIPNDHSPLAFVWTLENAPCGHMVSPNSRNNTNGYYHGPAEGLPDGCPPPPGIEINVIVQVLVARASDLDAKGMPRPGAAYFTYRQVARAGDAPDTQSYAKDPVLTYHGPPGFTPG